MKTQLLTLIAALISTSFLYGAPRSTVDHHKNAVVDYLNKYIKRIYVKSGNVYIESNGEVFRIEYQGKNISNLSDRFVLNKKNSTFTSSYGDSGQTSTIFYLLKIDGDKLLIQYKIFTYEHIDTGTLVLEAKRA